MFRCDGTGGVFTDAHGKFGDDSFYSYFAEGFYKGRQKITSVGQVPLNGIPQTLLVGSTTV